MLKLILGIIVVAVVGVVVIAAGKPDDYMYTRSLDMNAPPAKIFAQINDLSKWAAWNPWLALDPNAKTLLEGPKAGVGAISRWEGNNQMGSGSMTITDSKPNEHVTLLLEFIKPMPGTATSVFMLKPNGKATTVSWSMGGKQNLVQKVMGVVFNCEKMIGDKYDEGLASIKAIVEK
ncbi:MAG: SRPBCC family protein [Alphaproteobacteria bacterium]|nr:SRPBCC family protein [Alphaproteobacteria bacterium]